MDRAKRLFGLFLPVLVLVAMSAFIPNTVLASIAFTGDYSPADPANIAQVGIQPRLVMWGTHRRWRCDGRHGRRRSALAAQICYLGYSSGITGTAAVNGTGATFTYGANLNVGYAGTATLKITGGGTVSNTNCFVGGTATAAGTVTVDGSGSKWTSTAVYIGRFGRGTLNIQNGATAIGTSASYIGYYVGTGQGTVTVDGTGSTWTVSVERSTSAIMALGH